MNAGLSRLHWVKLIVSWRSRTSKIKYFVGLDMERQGNVVTHDPKVWIGKHMDYILLSSGIKIIDTQHIMALNQQRLAKMRTKKASPSRDQYTLSTAWHPNIRTHPDHRETTCCCET
jgi:hypothetical protein